MKRQIRFGVFETNSSMSHTLQLMSKDDYEELLNKNNGDEFVWDRYYDKWVKASEVQRDEYGDFLDLWRYGDYFDEEANYETAEYTTESGDVVVAISMAKEDMS